MHEDIKLGIVVSEFNSDITGKMLKQALKRSAELKSLATYVCKAPGSYDMPLMIQSLLEKDDVDAVVMLGAIIKGETKHDELIADKLAGKAVELSLQFGKPVTLGVSGPSMTLKQAVARTEEYANRSVEAAVRMVERQRKIAKSKPKKPSYPVVIE